MSEQIRREFTLAFPIEKVKASIEDACRTSTGSYVVNGRNPAFNSYNISLVKNLYVLPTTISLRAISENETHFEFSAIPGPRLTTMAYFTNELIEGFLGRIGDYASGRYVVSPEIAGQLAPTNKGCAIFFIIVGAAAALYISLG